MKRPLPILVIMTVLGCFALGVANAQPQAPDQVQPLLIGSTVPDAQITSLEGELVSLAEVVADQPTLLIFYRGGW